MSRIYYTNEHEWLNVAGDVATIGITDYAQEQLGDIVFIELPEVGQSLEYGDEGVVIESIKAASDVYAPASGKVVEINSILSHKPALVNSDAESDGWLYKIQLTNKHELEKLMEWEAYKALIG
ncbi:glycine cleavage system protein GcvH [Candidatus Endowatersipora endosymbiont of Watersipora subatra]|uniref:glycine cleavage system protein GcvH n=1 Tax=Candidatus Endowatersipora endosymbiont of Watersipora subatra TaxID=3077946 RepID=UPI00312CA873